MHNKALLLMVVLSVVFAAGAHAQLVDGYKGKYVMYYCPSGKPIHTFSYEIHEREDGLFEIKGEILYLNPAHGDREGKGFSKVVLDKECEIQSYAYEAYALNGDELGEKRICVEITFKRTGEKTQLVFRRGEREWTKEMPADWMPLFVGECNNLGIGYLYAALRLKPEMAGREFLLVTLDGANTRRWRLLEVNDLTADIGGRDYSGQAYLFEDLTPDPMKHPLLHKYEILFVRKGEFIAYIYRNNFMTEDRPCGLYMHIVEDFETDVKFVFPEQFK